MAEAEGRVEAWNWQCWRLLAKGEREWVGFFESEKDALSWTKGQKGDYVVNNVPPSGRLPSGRRDPNWATPVLDRIKDWTDTPLRSKRASKAVKPKVVPATPETAEQKALREDAAQIYAEHKAAEAAELEETDGS